MFQVAGFPSFELLNNFCVSVYVCIYTFFLFIHLLYVLHIHTHNTFYLSIDGHLSYCIDFLVISWLAEEYFLGQTI